MFKRLLPKEVNFFEYFESHADIVVKGSEKFVMLCSGSTDLPTSYREIKSLETMADTIVHTCHDSLNSTFITPLDRSDIHSLIKKMDDVIDCIHATSCRIDIYHINTIRHEAKRIAEIINKAAILLDESMHLLKTPKKYNEISKKCVGIHYLESEGDDIIKEALSNLFNETDAILIIKWKEIFDRLERALDRCDDVANILEKIVMETS